MLEEVGSHVIGQPVPVHLYVNFRSNIPCKKCNVKMQSYCHRLAGITCP